MRVACWFDRGYGANEFLKSPRLTNTMAQLNAMSHQLTETCDGLDITSRRLIATQEPLFAALHRLKMTNHRSNVAINRPDVVFKGHFVAFKGSEKPLRRGPTIFLLEALRKRRRCVVLACRASSHRPTSLHFRR